MKRRDILGGLAALLPAQALAVDGALRPKLRQNTTLRAPSALVALDPRLANLTGFALRDLSTGRILEEHQPRLSLPPASVTKAVTALYAIDALGLGYRFPTDVAVTGRVTGGTLEGDLYLIGGGDPTLDSDRLAQLARAVAAAGIRQVRGRTYAVGTTLPYFRNIDPGQPEHVGYNPAISGLNLNFNRVHFRWTRRGTGYDTELVAAGQKHMPAVAGIDIALANRKAPVFQFRDADGRDSWSVAAGALGARGARWLPVRQPTLYAAEVFRTLASAAGVAMPAFTEARVAPEDGRLARVESSDCARLLRTMLKYSTNLTAEVVGLRASQARGQVPNSLGASGEEMTRWLRTRYGLSKARFVNHSGLSDQTRMTVEEMVQLLDIAAATTPLQRLMRAHPLSRAEGTKTPLPGVEIRAKTGTLYFTRTLAGYIEGRGRRLAFAIFAADLNARAGFRANSAKIPNGSGGWRAAALKQERALLRHFANVHL
ncbi:MAG: D-alanyl-D-alanine carboxypeptidase/D-alanyl-D-alanine-endopeptidase [Pseudomonadota bacterium]